MGLPFGRKPGEVLGAWRKGYADGDLIGENGTTPVFSAVTGNGTMPAGTAVTVPVTIDDITFEVKIESGAATNTESIVAILKANIKNLTDEIAHSIAVSLEQVFANLPTAAQGL